MIYLIFLISICKVEGPVSSIKTPRSVVLDLLASCWLIVGSCAVSNIMDETCLLCSMLRGGHFELVLFSEFKQMLNDQHRDT